MGGSINAEKGQASYKILNERVITGVNMLIYI